MLQHAAPSSTIPLSCMGRQLVGLTLVLFSHKRRVVLANHPWLSHTTMTSIMQGTGSRIQH